MRRPTDALAEWLSLTWEQPERSYNPNLRDFLADVLNYPKPKVRTEERGSGGYPDLKLLTPEDIAWVVGDMKKEDGFLTDDARRASLWQDKRKYVDGLTRYVLFITAHYLWVALPSGETVAGFERPLDLRTLDLTVLRQRLAFLSYSVSGHAQQWAQFSTGTFPYSYLSLADTDTLRLLRDDLRAAFRELTRASTKALAMLQDQYTEYVRRGAEIERDLVGKRETQRRARVRLEAEFEFVRRIFAEAIPQFEEQYGSEVEARQDTQRARRVQEAFIADSVAALMARVLFLRLVEDLGLTQKRRLSNGGPSNWAAFVEQLTGDARALVRVASEDVARVYREPFARSVFDWIQQANGELDESLQRFILRLNAYNFAGLSEEVLGDIYQQFLPLQKRKQLGEYYTPVSIVDWILDRTVRAHGLGPLLDPSCGSGSFLVRYAHWRLEDAARRGLDQEAISREVQEEVWGFDLNPFASFVSLFQITWALLRYNTAAAPPQVNVYNLNSILKDSDIAAYIGEEHLAPGSKARDERRWKYVIGNPPYIRAERVKYGGEMRDLWGHVWGQNSDTGLIFLYRALTEWLEPGGYLGMVVSGGYANSEAAAKVWNLLQPGRGVALRQVVWLEFAEEEGRQASLWDAARVPLIIIIERAEAKADDEIELLVPSAWPSDDPPVKVEYADFFDKRISPNVTNPVSPWGDYLLPLLRAEDAPLLRKLYPDQVKFVSLGDVVKWTYGIQRGGVDVTAEAVGERPIQVIAGHSLAVAWPGEPVGWVDMGAVEKRPYGKPSLWRPGTYPEEFIAVTNIGLAPTAALVSSADRDLASIDTAIVSRNCAANAKAVCAFLNSSVARIYWASRLRSGVIQGYYAHVYPRTLESFPWPKNLSAGQEAEMAEGYERLAELAARAKNNPNEWLLAEAERRIEVGRLRLSEPSLGLSFPSGGAVEARTSELQLDGARLSSGLFPVAEFSDADAAEYVYRLLTLTHEEDAVIGPADVQKLVLPRDYAALMEAYRTRWGQFQAVEQDFFAALADVDRTVYAAFGVTDAEQAYIAQRLSTFPLSRLRPRYPWQTVRPRPIKAYMEDRFA